jgi:hypothetical protein
VGTPIQLDLVVDLNTMDDTGLPWAFLDDAIHPTRLVPGAYVIVGSGEVRAVAQVMDVDNDIVHVRPLRGSVASNAHLLSKRPGVTGRPS